MGRYITPSRKDVCIYVADNCHEHHTQLKGKITPGNRICIVEVVRTTDCDPSNRRLWVRAFDRGEWETCEKTLYVVERFDEETSRYSQPHKRSLVVFRTRLDTIRFNLDNGVEMHADPILEHFYSKVETRKANLHRVLQTFASAIAAVFSVAGVVLLLVEMVMR